MDRFQNSSWPAIAAISPAQERAFIRTVYGWMFGGLALTAFTALFVASSPSLAAMVFQREPR